MKKILHLILIISSVSFAQVGIGTVTPSGSLEIVSNNEGLIIPRIALTSTTDSTTVQTLTVSEIIYNTASISDVTPGFYYWNGTIWIRIGSEASNSWELLGNSGTIPGTNFIGTTDAQDLVFKTNNTENVRIEKDNGNLLVGGTYPSARLFLNTPNTNTTNNYGLRSILESNLGTLGSYSGYFVNNTNTSGLKYGLRSNISSAGSGRRYGGYFQTYGPNVDHSSQVTGILNEVFMGNRTASGTTSHFGIKNTLSLSSGNHTTSGDFIAFDNTTYGSGNINNANVFGIFNQVEVQGNGNRYGVFTNFPLDENTGNGNKYGYFSYIHPSAGGIHYGLYSQVTKANSFAGYFLGRVSIGTAVGNEYILPSTRGTNGQIMVTDATGNVTWANPSGGGSDADWYAEGTTAAPTNITDNIFTNGNVGIGDNTPDANLDIASSGDAKIIIEADTGNGAENNNPEIQLIQDGGAVTASIQLEGNTGAVSTGTGENDLLIRTTHPSSDIQILPIDNLTTTFKSNGQVQLNEYTTATTFTGTATSLLAVDNLGNIIQQPLAATSTDWSIVGNAGTIAGTNFLGTTDAQDLSFRTNNTEQLRIKTFGTLYTPNLYRNTSLGDFALGEFQTGTNTYNTAMGYAAGYPITSGTRNTLVGAFTGRNMTTARRNTAIGYYSLYNLTTGEQNVAIGRNALRDITTASNNVAIGDQSLEKLGTFNGRNVAVGRFTLSDMVNGNYNTVLGFQSGVYMDNAEYNIGIGAFSMGSTRSGGVATGASSHNIGIGTSSLSEINSGSHNIAMGERSLHLVSSGSNNLSLGNRSGSLLTTGSNNIFLGAFAGDLLTTESNLLYIENTSTNSPLIGGNFNTNRVGINVNTTSGLTHTLTVGGNVRATAGFSTPTNTYPDYVFENYFNGSSTINSEYKFTMLREAIIFVKENGHLPNVKSFEEIKANGMAIDLGETSIKNLEKIEENFLYISELNQKLEYSKKENETLKNRIEKLEFLVLKLIEENK